MTGPDAVRPRTSSSQTLGVILLIAAGGCAMLTIVVERRQRRAFEGALHTTGTVVAMLPRHGASGVVAYAPLVRYETNTGIQLDFTSSLSSSPPDYKVGDAVPVVYTPLNPQQAEIDRRWARWINTGLAGALTMILLLSATLTLLKGRRRGSG